MSTSNAPLAAADQPTAPQQQQPTPPDIGQNNPPAAPAGGADVGGAVAQPAGPVQPGAKQRIEQGTAHVLGNIFQTLAGGQKIVYQQGPNGPVKTYQDLKPGEMARGILAAAITGLASGYDPANRGRGPAMSSAFASGFKGEEQARENKEAGQEKEAQQQFTNKNVSDEMILRKQKAATEQQESIVRMAESTAHTAAVIQAAQQGKEVFTEQRHQHVLDQLNQRNADVDSGYTPLKDGIGRDISFATPEEALQALNKDPRHLLHPGDYDTKIEFNPNTSRYEPVLRPKNYEDKTEMRFVKLDKNGQPEKDSSGKFVPSGEKGPDGQVMPPTPMTGAQYGAYVNERDKAKYDAAEYDYKRAATAELIQKQKDDAETKQTNDNYFKAGGDPFRVNPETGAPYMTDRQIGILQNQAKTNVQMYGSLRKDLTNQLNAAATPEDRARISSEYDDVDAQYQKWSNALASMKPVDKATALAKSLAQEHSGDNGFDSKAALKQFDANQAKYAKAGYSAQELAAARQKLEAVAAVKPQETPKEEFGPSAKNDALSAPGTLDTLQAAFQKESNDGKSYADIQRDIKSDPGFSVADKKKLLNALPTIIPYKVTMQDGSTVNVSPDQMSTYLKSNPNIKVAPADQVRFQLQQAQEQKQEQQDKETQKETDINSQS